MFLLFQASSNLLGGTVKENEMLARAGIKPRTAANPSRTALGNISNRATVAGKQNLKDKEVSILLDVIPL